MLMHLCALAAVAGPVRVSVHARGAVGARDVIAM